MSPHDRDTLAAIDPTEPGPQDVREADEFSRLDNFPLEYQRNYYRSMYKRAHEAVEYWKREAGLAQSSPSQDVRGAACRALCKENGTAQCAPICLSHFSTQTTDGKCPEAECVWGRKADFVLAALAQSDAQPVEWQYRWRLSGDSPWSKWTECDRHYALAHAKTEDMQFRSLYTAPYRPDASGLVEAAEAYEHASEMATMKAADLEIHKTQHFGITALSNLASELLDEAHALRSRAADRSAPRSDKGGA